MPRVFEYLSVETGHTGVIKYTFKAKLLNGREIANWEDGPTLSDYLNQLGSEGWEMMIYAGTSNSCGVFYFKRERVS